jgi:hypothetical protein
MLESLGKADPRPLMAVLLANLPNLTTLYGQIPETDIFFRRGASQSGPRSTIPRTSPRLAPRQPPRDVSEQCLELPARESRLPRRRGLHA